jgi:CDP-diacylglycerol--glycerol-3-phosphate 3-phosphatidyltransferase/cardiolipin synthase
MNGTIKNYEVIAAIIILTREILISGLREFLAKGQYYYASNKFI